MFEIGSRIMYGNTGVCEVEGYATPDLPGIPRGTPYYRLRPLFQSGPIYCPVEQPKVFMRPVMSLGAVLLKPDTLTDLVEIIKSVYCKKREAEASGRRVSQLEDRYMKLAEELLHGELSVALGIPKDEVKDYIARRVREARTEE